MINSHWLDLHQQAVAIEPELGQMNIEALLNHGIVQPSLRGRTIEKIMAEIDFLPKKILLIHSFQIGGVEREAATAISVLASRNCLKDTLILATDGLDTASICWFERCSNLVSLQNYEESPLTLNDRILLLAQLINWWQPEAILNMHSYLGWRVLERFGKALSRRTAWSVGLFCRDRGANGMPLSHADRFLRGCFPFVESIICDNQEFIDTLTKDYALPHGLQKKFFCLYQPVSVVNQISLPAIANKKVLWAGRLSPQKRPELLGEIAALMPEVEFHVYSPEVSHNQLIEWNLLRSNIHIFKPFTEIQDIFVENYCAFLFTSAYEGLPNILLEIGSIGMPIVASIVGGVGELITSDTGWPIKPGIREAQRFSDSLKQVFEGSGLVYNKVANLVNLIRSRHSVAKYLDSAKVASSFFRFI